METIGIKWHKIGIHPDDTFGAVTKKLEQRQVNLAHIGESVYLVRISKGFIIDYGAGKLSPVIYIGRCRFRARMNAHRTWLGKLQLLLHGAPLEVKFCFPRKSDGTTAHKALEAHLLSTFKSRFGNLPLNNNKLEKPDRTVAFSAAAVGQTFGQGSGKSKEFVWSIKPFGKNEFGNNVGKR